MDEEERDWPEEVPEEEVPAFPLAEIIPETVAGDTPTKERTGDGPTPTADGVVSGG